MNDKQMRLIEAGVKLFANKGFYHTSIQEIATEAGVSKGSFYIYFESKEEFIVTAFRHFHERLTERLDKVKKENLPPKQILAAQISVLVDVVYHYKDFFSMNLKENISIGEHINELIHEMKEANFTWMRENLLLIYGDLNDLLLDTMIQLDGILNGYFKWIVIDDIQIDKDQAGAFIVARLDEIVNGMRRSKEKPLAKITAYKNQQDKEETLTTLRSKLKELTISDAKVKQLHEAFAALENETRKKTYNPVVIQGLLAHFSSIKELMPECKQLANLLDVELLS